MDYDLAPHTRLTATPEWARRLTTLPHGARITLFAAGIAFSMSPWASPATALALGMALALGLCNPLPNLSRLGSKWLLQASVVLLGFGMNLGVILRTGEQGLLFAAVTIVTTFTLGYLLGRWLRIARLTSLLISAGTAICGGSAIAAVGASVDADHGEMTVAMGTVFLLNAVALYSFPAIGHALGMSPTEFGTWAGVAIHDISSVVGTATAYGHGALQTATAVKLSRALWILPVASAAALIYGGGLQRGVRNAQFGFATNVTDRTQRRKLQVPWFIGLFLLASVLRSLSPHVAAVAPMLDHFAEVGLTLALFFIGTSLSRATLKAVGIKPLIQGVVLWIVVSGSSLLIILDVVH